VEAVAVLDERLADQKALIQKTPSLVLEASSMRNPEQGKKERP
jgi:hypothetical protein